MPVGFMIRQHGAAVAFWFLKIENDRKAPCDCDSVAVSVLFSCRLPLRAEFPNKSADHYRSGKISVMQRFHNFAQLAGRTIVGSVVAMIVAGSLIQPVYAQKLNWPFRAGPTLNSHVAAEDAEGLPTEWDGATGARIRWKLPLKEFGHSTPVIGDGRIWLTAATEDGKQQFVYCVNQQSGQVIHHKLVFENSDPEPLNNVINTYASPSCAMDASGVYVHFGSYGTAKLDPVTAEVIWQRRDIHCRHFRGPGSSPIIFEDLLVLTFDGIDRQFLTALNTSTGETVWLTERSTDYGDLDENGKPKLDGDIRKAYSTPA